MGLAGFRTKLNKITRDWTELVHIYEQMDEREKTFVHENYPFMLGVHEMKNRLSEWNNQVSKDE
ncbi:hypothetical protein [Pseudalkalibacillus caeni]|uniref:Uncharacterized protein n=1 Tax=Exobacillus caeni TaxID=2574798 RepID=A0A5R9F4D0_9BACL|nr:hypothetical protein [Pseudalkalibacillus caeni]TLS37881.1 hypothetical protein FCL54_08670 [Pseudalkalibacillus caeni]